MNDDQRAILGVGRVAGAEEIRAAYRRAAKRAHPDMGGSSEAFQRVRQAADALLAALEVGQAAAERRMQEEADRESRTGPWWPVSAELWEIWGREPTMVFAPQKIGLSPFVNERSLNRPAYEWLVRTLGPRGEGWDFHSAGSVTRIFFRSADEARLFQLRFF